MNRSATLFILAVFAAVLVVLPASSEASSVQHVDFGDRDDAPISEKYLTDMEDEDDEGEEDAREGDGEVSAIETNSNASPVTEGNELDGDLTAAGALGGVKKHHIDSRTKHDVEDEVSDDLVVDYQMDYTLYPSMDHTRTPYAKNAPPLEYVGTGERWTRSFDSISKKNVSGWAFESGKGFWMDLSKWHRDAMPTHTYTIDIVFKMDEGGGMRRIMSKTADSEEGLYVYDDKLVYWPHVLHSNPDAFKTAEIKKGEWVRVTLSRDGTTNQITGAVNGKPCWILSDTTKDAVLPNGKINLFSDTTRYSSSGTLGRVRVFKSALGYRHVKLMGRHAVDAVVRNYKYGRRIYRQLVIGDYWFQNTLISSVFTEYPLFVNNRTFEHPRYVKDAIEGNPKKKVNLVIPRYGLTYALDSAARLHHFDGEEFTISVLFKLENKPDQFQNILQWGNDRSQITLRVRNWQLYLSTHDKGEDLHAAMHHGHRKREIGRKAMSARLHDYLQSSQNEVLRRRLQRRLLRIKAEEARIREVELAKLHEESPESPGGQHAEDGAKKRPLYLKEEELRELRVQAGLEAPKQGSTVFSPDQYQTKSYEWQARHAAIENEDQLARRKELDEAAKLSAGKDIQKEPIAAGATTAIDEGERFGPDGPPEDILLADFLLQAKAGREEYYSSEDEPDLWEHEIKAHLPRTSIQEADKKIEECFLRGGKWRFDPIDKCSLDLEHDIEQPPRPYDIKHDLATSIHDSVKTDKWVALTVTRSLDGRVEGYVNGRRSFRYLDRNTTTTEIGGDNFKLFTPDARAPTNFEGQIGRVILYDQHLRSTEIREMVRGTKWSPIASINTPKGQRMIDPKIKETIPHCLVVLPIWNARSSHPGVRHGATMVWIRNLCRRDFQVKVKMCGVSFECNAQSASYMSCGTVVEQYCPIVDDITEIKDNSF